MRKLNTAILAVLAGAISGLLAFIAFRGDARAERYVSHGQQEIEQMVLADLERYGVDIYRLYLEISQTLPGMPGSDFAVDKAIKKLTLTYPESNIRRIADAFVVYGAIRKRDMLQIEQYLEAAKEAERKGRLLMPNGYEIVPQLGTAQYNYLFHVGRLDEAEKTLDWLQMNYGGSFVFQPQGKPLSILEFVKTQRRILEIVRRKETK